MNSGLDLGAQSRLATAGAAAEREVGVAFLGTYGPRRCGIASFTADLAIAVAASDRRVLPMILAVTEPSGQYQYPSEVKFEIRQSSRPAAGARRLVQQS